MSDTYVHTIEEHEEERVYHLDKLNFDYPEAYECDECHLCICKDPSEIGPGEHRAGCSSYDWSY